MEVFSTRSLPGSDAWAWSKGQHTQPLLAVLTGSNAVAVLTAQGSPWPHAKGGIRNVRGTPAVCLTWHPDKQLLAIAWQDGAVSIWDAAKCHLEEDSKAHRQSICQLLWHPDGKHFMTADVQGKVSLWEVNSDWQPRVICSHAESGGAITHSVWLTSAVSTPAAAAAAVMVCYALSTPGSATVTLKCLDSKGTVTVVQDVGEDLVSLLHYQEKGQLIAVTSSGSAIILNKADSTGSTSRAAGAGGQGPDAWNVFLRMKVTNAATGAGLQVCWAGPHTLALAGSQDTAVRMLQLDTDDNYLLDLRSKDFVSTSRPTSAAADAAGIVALAYEPGQHVLAAATATGRVCLFRHWLSKAHAAVAAVADPASQWEPSHSFLVGSAPAQLGWGPAAQVLAASCADGLYLGQKSPLHHKLSKGYAAVQVATGRVLVQRLDGSGAVATVSTALQIASIDGTEGALLLHDGWHAEVYKFSDVDGSSSLAAQFEVQGLPTLGSSTADASSGTGSDQIHTGITVGAADGRVSMALHGDCLYRTAEGRVEICTWAGVVRQTLPFDVSQGQPFLLDINNGYLAVLTSNALVRVFKLAAAEAKPHAGPGPLISPTTCGSLQIDCIRVNCDGSMVCALASLPHSGGCQDPRLFAYSASRNSGLVLDFTSDLTAPKAVAWDLSDPRLLAVQTGALVRSQAGSRPNSGAIDGSLITAATGAATAAPGGRSTADAQDDLLARSSDVATVFATDEAGLLLQEYQDLDLASSGCVGFLGVSAPHLLLLKGSAASQDSGSSAGNFADVPLRCFSGLAGADDATRRALLDFNYLLAMGKLEEAFRAVSALKSPAVWRNMAHMAIKNKQLAVAEHCLGNMQHIRGARALHQSADVPELDARVGLVAVQLGLTDDAARLFSGCERWDLLEQLHAASGGWPDALQVATKHDRARLQALHHACARHHEAIGDIRTAVQQYTAGGTAATEVARMLWQAEDMSALERQVAVSDDVELLTWWARACEASGNYAQAISCYQRAGNQLAVLRIYCATGDWAAAEQLVSSTRDAAAAFHLARLYEAQDKVQDALRCYSISKRYSHGARLAKRCQMDQELLSFALQSPRSTMLDAADHLLAAGNTQAAALLYQKGGKLGKAVEMAFAAGMMDVLDSITAQLDQDADADLMARCADAFVSAGRFEAAVRLLVKGKQPERALELLLAHEVPLTEELAEALTPPKTADNNDSRNSVLLHIAQAAKAQGLFHLACKKYTQAGDRLRAMRALIKSGDVEKIIFFAGVSRQREVYIMAANYLQTLNWRAQPEYLSHILTFYTKAAAADKLAQFYIGCAQTELNQFRSYDKAVQALQEAAKHLAKSRSTDREAQVATLQESCERMGRFVQAQACLAQDPATAVAICQQLLQEAPEHVGPVPDVVVGDVYALLVEWCHGQGNMQQAMQLVEQMLDRHVPPGHYLSPDVLAAVQQALGAGDPALQQRLSQHAQEYDAQQQPADTQEDLPYIRDEVE